MSATSPGYGPIRPGDVSRSFDEHAESYDGLVGANPGYHEHLRMSARRMGLGDSGAGLRLLDLGCGTGASTAALLEVLPHADITAVDASSAMLREAARKSWPPNVRFVHGDAAELAQSNIHGPFDGILAAYLVRNLAHPDAALRQFRAYLKPGAPLALHEYSVRDSMQSRATWTAVCWTVIIPMGRIRTGSADLYRYLWRSVLKFDGVRALTQRLRAAGFEDVRVQTVPGWQQHIVHTFLGRRPGVPGPDAPTPPGGIDGPVEKNKGDNGPHPG